MSREIKFRAFMVEDNYIETSQGLVKSLIGEHGDGTSYHVMQYTGLKDRNGVEIYEGDILAFYSTDQQRVTKYQAVKWESSKLGFNFTQKPTVKVIGNIYETPELLTKKGER